MNILLAPVLSDVNNNYDAKLKWDTLKSRDIEKYCQMTQVELSKVKVHAETHICLDLFCKALRILNSHESCPWSVHCVHWSSFSWTFSIVSKHFCKHSSYDSSTSDLKQGALRRK